MVQSAGSLLSRPGGGLQRLEPATLGLCRQDLATATKSSPEHANDRRRDASIQFSLGPTLRRLGTDRAPFSFNPELPVVAVGSPNQNRFSFRVNLLNEDDAGF